MERGCVADQPQQVAYWTPICFIPKLRKFGVLPLFVPSNSPKSEIKFHHRQKRRKHLLAAHAKCETISHFKQVADKE